MTAALLPLLLLASCAGDDTGSPAISDEAAVAADYHGLGQGRSWIYRDDASAEVPAEADLLRAREDTSSGTVEFRRGERWADASPAGHLAWQLDEDGALSLVSWSLPGGDIGEPAAALPVLPATSAPPVEVESEDGVWSCAVTRPEGGIETYHGTFEDALLADCTGGVYGFGRGAGLVLLETAEGYTLDLVAPW